MSNTNDVFKDFHISSHAPLNGLKRSKCPTCKASRMYFCYTCYKYVENINIKDLPTIKLPFTVDIIKHPKELDGKSTAVHAALLAPNDVRIYSYPVFPDYSKVKDELLLIFPSPDSQPLEDYAKVKENSCLNPLKRATHIDTSKLTPLKQRRLQSDSTFDYEAQFNNKEGQLSSQNGAGLPKPNFTKVVMIDSTWNQVHGISTDERLKGIRAVELTEQSTLYWRRQHNSPDYFLATIEALHAFLRQYHEIFIGPYDHEYDDLLYFFKFFHEMVNRNKSKKPGKGHQKT
ncbi:tRNA-uridine aminocarboxypropyltransferase 1-like [Clavelina lepadiformis]|uniref:tRNA-uridine aminocarboxypropyltransferase 1-like n=1 Tax=Clavelina lepadiformis TaxID=159417 RepID=UPI00404281E7